MTSLRRLLPVLGLAAASALVLAGCAGTAGAGDDARRALTVVASTNVYGQIAEEVGGDLVDVTSIISQRVAGPALVRAERAATSSRSSKADLIIENGGGYDAFIDG